MRRDRAGLYAIVAVLSWPILKTAFRLRARDADKVPDEGGLVLAANHWSNFDPWPLGLPLFPRRFLRFMAKAELFWFPLGSIVSAGGAFRVRRGERDEEAIATAVALCRSGHAVVMFPEGTRRRKGSAQEARGRWRTGAARIALEARRAARPRCGRGHRAAREAGAAARPLRRRRSISTISGGFRSRRVQTSPPSASGLAVIELEESLA